MSKRQILFFLTVTGLIAAPVLVAFCASDRDASSPISLAYDLGNWHGKDLPMAPEVRKNYEPLDAKLLLRQYSRISSDPGVKQVGVELKEPVNQTETARVDCVVQDATNLHQLHDLFACLQYSKANPRKLKSIKVEGARGPHTVSLYEYTLNKRKHIALFSYQSKAGAASYPPTNFPEQAHLAVVGRVPCRLTELTTPVAGSRRKAISRLKEFASIVCAQPL
jgi:hypothetical protein